MSRYHNVVDHIGEGVHHLLDQDLIVVVRISKARGVHHLKEMCIPKTSVWTTHSKVLISAKPRPKAVRGLLGARVLVGADLEQALVGLGVAAEEGVGQGRLARSCGSDDHNPGVGQVWHQRPLPKSQ